MATVLTIKVKKMNGFDDFDKIFRELMGGMFSNTQRYQGTLSGREVEGIEYENKLTLVMILKEYSSPEHGDDFIHVSIEDIDDHKVLQIHTDDGAFECAFALNEGFTNEFDKSLRNGVVEINIKKAESVDED